MESRLTTVNAESTHLAIAADTRTTAVDDLRLSTVSTDSRTVLTVPTETLYIVEAR